jgi:hypothetical protein
MTKVSTFRDKMYMNGKFRVVKSYIAPDRVHLDMLSIFLSDRHIVIVD